MANVIGLRTVQWLLPLQSNHHSPINRIGGGKMPLDFNKLRDANKQPLVNDPVEIFRRLPKKVRVQGKVEAEPPNEVANA